MATSFLVYYDRNESFSLKYLSKSLMQESLSSSRVVARSAFFNLLGFGISILYMVFLVPLVVRYVGVEEYGLWTLLLALTGYVGLVDLGIGTSFVPYIARYASLGSHDDVNKVILHGLLFYTLFSVLILGIGYFISPWLFALVRIPVPYLESARSLFLVALVGFAFSTIAGVFGSVLNALQRMDSYNIFLSVVLLGKFGAILIALSLGYGLFGLMMADLIVTAASLAPLLVLTRKHFPRLALKWQGYDSVMMKTLLKFGTQLQVSRLAEAIQAHFDKLILSRFIGLSAVSMYDFGSRPGGRLRSLPLTAVSSLVPAVSALDAADNRARILAGLIRSTRYLAIVSVPLFAYFMCFADDVVYVWLGGGFGQAAQTLRILSCAHLVSVIAGAMALVSQGMGQPGVQMRTTLIQAILNIVLSIVLVILFGFYGAVAGTTISAVVGSLLLFAWYGRRLIDRPLTAFVKATFGPALSIVPSLIVGGGMVLALEHLVGLETRAERGALLVLVALVFLILYAVMLVRSGTLSSDDRAFAEGIMPTRLKYLLRYL